MSPPLAADAGAATRLLVLDGVGKDYPKLATRGGRLRLVANLLRGRAAADSFRALDDVSFAMRRGQSLAVIGENGAGKSTLLKIVAGVIRPTRGRVDVQGRIAALLELGSGFHPEYTGYANIDLAAALLGLDPGRSPSAARRSSSSPTSGRTSTIRSRPTRPGWWCASASRSPRRSRPTS